MGNKKASLWKMEKEVLIFGMTCLNKAVVKHHAYVFEIKNRYLYIYVSGCCIPEQKYVLEELV